MIAYPALACGLCFGVGVIGIALFWPRASEPLEPSETPQTSVVGGVAANLVSRLRSGLPRLGLAVLVGTLALVITGWPVALPLAAAAAYGVPALFSRTSGSISIAKIEAIAVWTETLQGTLAASAGLSEAIIATSALSPPDIREATMRLSTRLGSGVHPGDALLQFADELHDPSADRVVCALLLAVSSRAQRLGELLSALADSTREEVALRLRIETSRASVRSSVRTVLVFSIVFAAALTILGKQYLAPFGSGTGQVVLLLVGVLYAVGLTLMVALARPPAPIRLIGDGVIGQ